MIHVMSFCFYFMFLLFMLQHHQKISIKILSILALLFFYKLKQTPLGVGINI